MEQLSSPTRPKKPRMLAVLVLERESILAGADVVVGPPRTRWDPTNQ